MPPETQRKGRAIRNRKKLDDVLLEVIDNTLKQVFKEPGARVIYAYLQKNPYLKLEEIAQKPELFSDGLKQLLGSGASVVEGLILRNLHSELDWEYEDKEGYGFSCYIRDLKEKCH